MYVGKPITLVEIGVQGGGSLFFWRDFLGKQAQIIGIDLDPSASALEQHGFKIFIGDQSLPSFWSAFYEAVGPIDILIDDGGHSNKQQIITLMSSLDYIKDGGVILIEDTHASYMKIFGNPSPTSLMCFSKQIVDCINGRSPNVSTAKFNSIARQIHSAEFFESIVAFKINRSLCKVPINVESQGLANAITDLREMRHLETVRHWGRSVFVRSFMAFCSLIHPDAKAMLKRTFLRMSYWSENKSLKSLFDISFK
jgi:hypothetical protein